MGNSVSRCLCYRGVSHQSLVDLDGGNLFSAPIDQLAEATMASKEPRCVQDSDTAGSEPAANEHRPTEVWSIEIARDQAGSAHPNLASLTGSDLAPLANDNHDRASRGDPTSSRFG